MSVGYNPKVITNGLVLCLDAANPKSYPGLLGSELVTTSTITQIDGTTFNIIRDAVQNITLTLCSVESGKTYYVDYLVTSYTGTVGATFRINNGGGNLTPILGISSAGRFNAKFTANISGTLSINGDNTGTNMLVDYVSVREVLSGTGQTCFDLSKNGYNATLISSPTYSTANNGKFIFNGSNNHLQTSAVPAQLEYTFMFYCKWLTETNFNSRCFGLPGYGTYTIYNPTNVGYHYNPLGGSPPSTSMFSGVNVGLNNWCHIALSESRAGSIAKIYINGILRANTSVVSSSGFFGQVNIGGQKPVDVTMANCEIPNFSLYNRVLSDNEILQNFNATRGRFGI